MSESVSNALHQSDANMPRLDGLEPPFVSSGELSPTVLNKSLDNIRDRGSAKSKYLIVGALGLASIGSLTWLADRAIDRIVPALNFSIPEGVIPEGVAAEPGKLEAETAPELYRYEAAPGFYIWNASAKVGAAVKVTGEKKGILWGGPFGATTAKIDKVVFGDFWLATEGDQINDTLIAERVNDKVVRVSVVIDALKVVMPRVDFSDFRNQIKIKTKDTPEEIETKIDEYIEDGSHYDPESGYSCGLVCDTNTIELVKASNILAQYALTIDSYQPDIIADATSAYVTSVEQQLAEQYDIDVEKVDITVVYGEGTDPNNPPTPEEVKKIYQDRMDAAYEEALREHGAPTFAVLPELREDDEGNLLVFAKLDSGAELTANLSGITYTPEIREIILSNIKDAGQFEIDESRINVNGGVGGELYGPALPEVDQTSIINCNGGVGTEKYGPPAPLPAYDQPPAPTAKFECAEPLSSNRSED